jgi:hypothetical protein
MQWFQDKQEFIKVCHDNTIPKKQWGMPFYKCSKISPFGN